MRCAGHSLGGAVSTILALRLKAKGYDISQVVLPASATRFALFTNDKQRHKSDNAPQHRGIRASGTSCLCMLHYVPRLVIRRLGFRACSLGWRRQVVAFGMPLVIWGADEELPRLDIPLLRVEHPLDPIVHFPPGNSRA